MDPPFKKNWFGASSDHPKVSRISVSLADIVPMSPKIRKSGPFKLPSIKEDHHTFCHLLGELIESIPELPDFSDDKKIAVMSDYGGEHRDARYNTYAFLFLALDKIGPFQTHMQSLRDKHRIGDPYSEFAYKDLKYGPRSRALEEYLRLVDSFIHGAVVTVAIDRKIGSVFEKTKREALASIEKQLDEGGFGKWTGDVGEKVLRVLHILTAFTAAMTYDQQRLFWYSDADQINEGGKGRSFAHTQKLFNSIGAMYMTHGFEVLGFGKSFSAKGYLDDLLSVPDLAAGMLQDLLTSQDTGMDINGGREKTAILRWLASPSKFLSKIYVQFSAKEEGSYEARTLSIEPVVE